MRRFSAVPKSLPVFAAALYVPPVLGLIAVALVSRARGIPLYIFMRDPGAIANISPLAGIASDFGVLGWCAAAALSLFSFVVIQRATGGSKLASFFLYFGLLTVVLLLDDFFMLHEYMTLGRIPEQVVFGCYAAAAVAGLIAYRDPILATDYFLLLLALGFLACSIAVDLFQYRIELILGDWRILLEDGFKLLGIVGWFGYFFRCSLQSISIPPAP